MSTSVKVLRDAEGTPTEVVINDRGRKTTLTYAANLVHIKGDLTQRIQDILKLFYPYTPKPLNFFEQGEFVQADNEIEGAPTTTDIYTVPMRKKLYVLTGFLMSEINAVAVAGPWESSLYIYNPSTGQTLDLINHYWTFGAQGYAAFDTISEINAGYGSGWIVRLYATAQVTQSGGFTGVLKDA